MRKDIHGFSKIEKGQGRLFVVGTPIGNLEDLTMRAKRVLREVKVVVCEDTRRTRKLLSAIGSKARLISCYREKEMTCAKEVLALLAQGMDCAFVADAGTPNVSDPGGLLVEKCFHAGIKVVSVPGVSAVTALLSCSPFRCNRFFFAGFLPEKAGKRREFLQELSWFPWPMCFFVPPHSLKDHLQAILDVLGDRRVLMGRELTKLHEELVLTSVAQALRDLSESTLRGEYTIVVEGLRERSTDKRFIYDKEKLEAIDELVALLGSRSSPGTKGLSKLLSRLSGMKSSIIYQYLLEKSEGDRGGSGSEGP